MNLDKRDEFNLKRGEAVKQTMETEGWKYIIDGLMEIAFTAREDMMLERIKNPYDVSPKYMINNDKKSNLLLGKIISIIRFMRSLRKVKVTEEIRMLLRGRYSILDFFTTEIPQWIDIARNIRENQQQEKK